VTSGYVEHPAGVSRERMWRARGIADGIHRVGPDTSPDLFVGMLAYMSPAPRWRRADAVRRWGGFYERDRCLYARTHSVDEGALKRGGRLQPQAARALSRGGFRAVQEFAGRAPRRAVPDPPRRGRGGLPRRLRELLARVLATRALKTACVLGYWGQWREARALTRRFDVEGAWRLSKYVPAQVCGTPLGAGLGRAWRALLSLRLKAP
jgi:hypothetical protein